MRDLWHLIAFLLRLARQIRFSRMTIAGIAAAGAISGLANTAVIALVTAQLARRSASTPVVLAAFAGLGLGLPFLRFLSQAWLIDLSQGALMTLRLRLSRQVLAAPLRQLEAMGPSRLLATLTADVGFLTDALGYVPVLLMNLALVVSCLAYLGWLSWKVLLEISACIVLGVVTYQLPVMRASRHFRAARERYDGIARQIRAMMEGTKELKMHRSRRLAFLAQVEAEAEALRRENRAGSVIAAAAQAWGQALFILVLALLVLVLPRLQPVAAVTLIGYTMVLFQIMGPLEVLLNALPVMSRAAVAARKVESLGLELPALDETAGSEPAAAAVSERAAALARGWERLELAGVTHTYRRENEDETFQLGPIDLVLHPGELVFLVGGNGCGKTTLAKLLLGLYAPETGSIRFAGQLVDDAGRERYREHFAAVFADCFVFEQLLGLAADSLDGDARRYLGKLHLDRKVRIQDGVLSTIDLSQGQRKRLALLTAYLEDRPIYLFDEWAADQDPLFKQVFYLELLPELKRRGRTILVITHDDHYFHVADRIVKMENGRIESDTPTAEPLVEAVAGPRL